MKKTIYSHPVLTKIFVSFIAIVCGIFVCATPAFACTGIYVGSEASEDGTTMIARSNDCSPLDKPFTVKVFGGQDGEQIRHLKAMNGFEWDFPEKIYRTICYPTVLAADGAAYYATAMNDQGVYFNGTVTGYSSEQSLEYNPYAETGILEDVFPLVVCSQASSTREGIDLTAKIIDERGSFEDNMIMIADQNEAWYMEIYGGHEYCAIKAPADCVTATGNEFLIETIDEASPDVICSPNLFKLPAEKGFGVYDNGKLNLWKTYAGPETEKDTCRLRTWRVHSLLSPSTSAAYNLHTKLPLFYKPDKKVSLNDVMDIYRDRYEGTEFSLDTNGPNSYRSINTETSMNIFLGQIYKDVPANMSILNWTTWSNSEFNTWLPFSNMQSSFDEAYLYENPNYYNLDDNNAFSAYKKLNAIAAQNRAKVKKPLSDYCHFYEHYISQVSRNALHEAANSSDAQSAINNLCKTWQSQNYYDAKRLANEIEWYYMNTENSYNVKTVDGIHQLKEVAPFSPYVDVVLAAKMLGWKIDEDQQQKHGDAEYDKSDWGNEEQANNGGMEGHVVISNGPNSAEIQTGNGHRLSKSHVTINGQDIEANAKIYDGKTYVQFNFVNELLKLADANAYTSIDPSDISPARSYEKIDAFNLPVWTQVLIVVAVAIVIAALIYLFIRISKKGKK